MKTTKLYVVETLSERSKDKREHWETYGIYKTKLVSGLVVWSLTKTGQYCRRRLVEKQV